MRTKALLRLRRFEIILISSCQHRNLTYNSKSQRADKINKSKKKLERTNKEDSPDSPNQADRK